MDFLNYLSGDIVFLLLALFVVIVYIINRMRTKKKFKR
jgi:hypothetical protein